MCAVESYFIGFIPPKIFLRVLTILLIHEINFEYKIQLKIVLKHKIFDTVTLYVTHFIFYSMHARSVCRYSFFLFKEF